MSEDRVEDPRSREIEERITFLRKRMLQDEEEFYNLVNPTHDELVGLEMDLQYNPHIYASYLIEDAEAQNKGWVAENVYEERKAQEENGKTTQICSTTPVE